MSELDNYELKQLCETAKTAALNAGKYIQSQFDKNYTQQSKQGGGSLASQIVIEVDFKAQQIILEELRDSIDTYNLGLLTEESADDESRHIKDYFWCIDPMDGTLPFTERRTGYAVSIALVSKLGHPIIGVVYIPDLHQCYSSIIREGVFLNGLPIRPESVSSGGTLHWYMDRSFQSESYFALVKKELDKLAQEYKLRSLSSNIGFGAVRNAIAVMTSGVGCYFKFPKETNGGGSIWDFAATRLFFEELDLWVSNAHGDKLDLNRQQTTFMNGQGVVYASNEMLAKAIIQLSQNT